MSVDIKDKLKVLNINESTNLDEKYIDFLYENYNKKSGCTDKKIKKNKDNKKSRKKISKKQVLTGFKSIQR